MIFLRKTTQAVTLLLVLLMSTMLVLPPGMDLELCFGRDGHVDFSLSSCQDSVSPKVPAGERPSVYDTAHHGECFDVAVACTTQELICTEGKTKSDKFRLKKDPPKTPLLFVKPRADSAGGHFDSKLYSISNEDFPPPHLVSLRTVVLLI